jgi:hypothetical protein
MKIWCKENYFRNFLLTSSFSFAFLSQASITYVCKNADSPIAIEHSFDTLIVYKIADGQVEKTLERVFETREIKAKKKRKAKTEKIATNKFESNGGDWEAEQNYTDEVREITLLRAAGSEEPVVFTCSE